MNQILAAYLAKSKVLFFFAIKVSFKACSVVSTQSARQYEDKFRQHYNSFTVANLGEPNRFGQNCYDATWILALALNNTLTGMVPCAIVKYSTTVIMIIVAVVRKLIFGHALLETAQIFNSILSSVHPNIKLGEITELYTDYLVLYEPT